jgi:hypothetical protein
VAVRCAGWIAETCRDAGAVPYPQLAIAGISNVSNAAA